MKTVYLDADNTVREIIPDYALPVETFYGVEFAARCVQAPDNVEQRWKYDPETGDFSPPAQEDTAAPEPTEQDRLRADVDFLAALAGVEL